MLYIGSRPTHYMALQLGVMNHPTKDVIDEIKWISENGFDFVDFTIEPTKAGTFDVPKVKKALAASGLGIVGHTTPFLPFILPVQSIRRACLGEFERCAKIFSKLGAELINIHPSYGMPFHSIDEKIEANISFFSGFAKIAEKHNLTPMIENFTSPFDNIEVFREVFRKIPWAKMHLDIGHANLRHNENQAKGFFRAFGKKIAHVHVSDNNGEEDEHLPLGCGNIDWKEIAGVLKKNKYSGTVTLEVFSPDRDYLLLSREKFSALFKSPSR